MKYQIMLEILLLLLARKKVTARELATEYGVSRRTIMRYIEAIELAGIPVYSEKGRYGGFFLTEGFKLQTNLLTKEEIYLITDILNSCKHVIGLKQAETLKNKLIAISNVDSNSLSDNTNRFIILGEDLTKTQCAQLTTKLAQAIKNCNQTVICYNETLNTARVETLEPHAILLKNGVWHLLAYCNDKNKFATYKMHDITEVFLCKQTFKRKNYVS